MHPVRQAQQTQLASSRRRRPLRLPPAALEDWLRDYYFETRYDLGSSGVQPWSMAQLRELLHIDRSELDAVVFDDSESYGGAELRAAIATLVGATGAGTVDPSHVMVTHGSSEAIFLLMASLLDIGDEVVVVDPGYHALSSVAQAVGCRLRTWALSPDRDFAPDLDRLSALIGAGTRMIVVNFPHNPTGVTLTATEQDALIAIAERHGAYLVWDAAFAGLTHGGRALPDPVTRYERAISLGTLSKAFGLPGLRVGWCVAQPPVLAGFLPLRDRLTICLSPLIERLALHAVRGGDVLMRARLAQASTNLAVLEAWARANADLIDWYRPAGGVTAFPRLAVGESSTDALCRELAVRDGVLLVPGSCFGHPDRVRLGFGGDADDFAEGLARLAAAVAVAKRADRRSVS